MFPATPGANALLLAGRRPVGGRPGRSGGRGGSGPGPRRAVRREDWRAGWPGRAAIEGLRKSGKCWHNSHKTHSYRAMAVVMKISWPGCRPERAAPGHIGLFALGLSGLRADWAACCPGHRPAAYVAARRPVTRRAPVTGRRQARNVIGGGRRVPIMALLPGVLRRSRQACRVSGMPRIRR